MDIDRRFLCLEGESMVRRVAAHHLEHARARDDMEPGAFSGSWKGVPVLLFPSPLPDCRGKGFYIGACEALVPGLPVGGLAVVLPDGSQAEPPELYLRLIVCAQKNSVRLIAASLEKELRTSAASGLCVPALLTVTSERYSGRALGEAEIPRVTERAAVLALEALALPEQPKRGQPFSI